MAKTAFRNKEIAQVGKEKGIYLIVVRSPGLKIPIGRNCIATEILIFIVKAGIYNLWPCLDTCLVAMVIKKAPFSHALVY